jgi:N4-gp56 family major capsid protein
MQFCDAKDGTMDGYGKELHAGENFHWNVYSDIDTQGTTLGEGTAMPESQFTVTQGTLTVTEYGNSVPYSGKLDDLSFHPVKEIINKVLKNDAKKAFDIASHAQFNATPLVVQPTGGTDTSAVTIYTDGTATQTIASTATLGKEHVKSIVDAMKERNIEPYMGDDYFSISHPTTYRGFKNDLEAVHQYVDAGFQMILHGETGRYEGVRFVEQNNIAKLSGVNGSGGWSYFFGGDTVAEAFVIPEEIRGKIPTDYGRSKGVAWYALLGYGIVHTAAAQARILKWTTL